MQTAGKKQLIRMNTKRNMLLESIITSINEKIESVDEDSFGRLLLLNNYKLSEEEKKERLKKLDAQLKSYSLLHDVLEVVINHENDIFLNIHMREQRGWRNEWDIPIDVFNESMDEVIKILKENQYPRFVQVDENYIKRYDEKIKFLLELKAFRNAE